MGMDAEGVQRLADAVRWRGVLAQTALWLMAFLTALASAYHFLYADVLLRFNDSEVSLATVEGWYDVYPASTALPALGVIGVSVAFLFWQWAVEGAARRLGGVHFRLGPEWSVIWWFIPLANLVMPKLGLDQAWRGLDPSTPHPDARGARAPVVGWLWWAALLLAVAGWVVTIGLDPLDYAHVIEERDWELAYGALTAGSVLPCALGALTVRRFQWRLDARAAALRAHLEP